MGQQHLGRFHMPTTRISRILSQPSESLHRQVHIPQRQGHICKRHTLVVIQRTPVNATKLRQGVMLQHSPETVVRCDRHQAGKVTAQFQPSDLVVIAPISGTLHITQLVICSDKITLQNQFASHQQA